MFQKEKIEKAPVIINKNKQKCKNVYKIWLYNIIFKIKLYS